MKLATLILLAALLIALNCGVVRSQDRWQTYTSPDKSFSVKLPAALRSVMSFEGEHGANLAPDQKDPWTTCYAAIETTPEESRFGIVVINAGSKSRRSQPRAKLLWYLSAILIGDDDDPDPEIQKTVTVNGLKGREYFHIRENLNGTGEIHTRGRIFDRGKRIYVITFVGRDTKDLTSTDAERFLNSFRLHKRATRGRHRRT